METFRKKARELGCHIKQVEPHSPWQNAAEGAIRELKHGAGRKMMASGAPQKLRDHCIELQSGMSLLSGMIQVLSFLNLKNAMGGGLVLLWTLAQL